MPPASPALPRLDGEGRRERVGVVLAVALLLLTTAVDAALPDRAFPLTATLLGPLVASGLCRPRMVALVSTLSVCCALLLAVEEDLLHGAAGWTRVALVAAAAVLSVGVAQVRTRHERQLALAHRAAERSLTLQHRLIPNVRPTGQVDVRVTYRPSAEDLVVGGDFIDVIPFPHAGPGAVAFCVGDVTGHDASAAGLAASLRAAWRALALSGGEPSAWLQALDEFVRAEAVEEELATACAGILDPARRCLVLASAGHPRPILLAEHARLVDIEPGPPLGMPADLSVGWVDEAVGLDTDFALVLYTDGLVEGRRAPGSAYRYGEESLTAWLDAVTPARAITDHQIARLLRDVEAANGGPLQDDLALVVLASTAASAEPAAPGGLEKAVTPDVTVALPAPRGRTPAPR